MLPTMMIRDVIEEALDDDADDSDRRRDRHHRNVHARSGVRRRLDTVPFLQGLSRAAGAPHRTLAVAPRPAGARAPVPEPDQRDARRRHSSRRAHRFGHHARPCDRHRGRRNGGHRRRRVDPALGHARRLRQGDRATATRRSAAACCWRPAARSSATSRSAKARKSAPAAWCYTTYRRTSPSPVCRR